jgi:hypothetical protein
MDESSWPEDPRLHRLFEDLEAEFEAGLREEQEQQVVAALRAQAGETALWERLARSVGSHVVVRAGTATLHGTLIASYSDFYGLQSEDGAQHFVRIGPGSTIALASGSAALQPAPTGIARRFGFALALRELARRREPVRVLLVDGGTVWGTIEAAGRDYLELAEHDPGEPRRETAVRARRLVGFAAVVMVTLPPLEPPGRR